MGWFPRCLYSYARCLGGKPEARASLSLCTVSTSPHDIWKIAELLPWCFRNPGSCGTSYRAFHGLTLEVLECHPIIIYLSSMFFKPTQNQEKENSSRHLTSGAIKYLWSSVIYHTALKFSIIFFHTIIFNFSLTSVIIKYLFSF